MENRTSIRANTIAVCVADVQNEIETLLCNTMAICARERGYHIEFYSIFGDRHWERMDKDDESLIYNIMPYERLCGIVVFVEKFTENQVNAFVAGGKQLGIPVICIDGRRDDATNVMFNYTSGFEQVVRHVIEHHGCRRLFFMAGTNGARLSDERLEIFKRVIADYDIPFDRNNVGEGMFWSEPAREVMLELLSRKEPVPEAIICANDTMAATVCDVLLEHGYIVPKDVIVTGFDGVSEAEFHNPRITTVRPNYDAMARSTISAIDDYVHTGEVQKRDYNVGLEFIPSESCGCRKRSRELFENRTSELYGKLQGYNTSELVLIRMVSRAVNSSSVTEIAESTREAVHAMLDCDYFYWCMSDDFITYKDERRAMPRNISSIVSYVGGKFSTRPIQLMGGEIIPDYDKHVREETPLMIYPVFVKGILYGYLAIGFKPGVTDFMNFRRFCQNINNIVGVTVQQMKLNAARERMRELYHTDVLTGLLNRAGFMELKNQMLEKSNGKTVVVINADLNNLKYINDTYGHKEGDKALIIAARILKNVIKDNGLIARYGGDEYAAMYVTDKAPHIEKMLLDVMFDIEHQNANREENVPFEVHVSVGVSAVKKDDSYNFEKCYKEADEAMYKAKRQYKKEHPLGSHFVKVDTDD